MEKQVLEPSRIGIPDIFGFHDYREFLIHWFDYLMQADPRFSLRSMADRAGLSAGYLSSFLAGRIGMSSNALGKILPFLNMSTQHKEYLKLLRTVCESENPEERKQIVERLFQFREKIGLGNRDLDAFQYMSHWHTVAIREMASLPNFRLDSRWIQKRLRFPVSIEEIEESIRFLINKKMLIIESDGSCRAGGVSHLTCQGGLYRLVLSKYHEQLLELAQQTFGQTKRKDRAFLGHTFVLTIDQIDEIRDVLSNTINKIKEITEKRSQPRRGPQVQKEVFHLELCLFPLTQEGIVGEIEEDN